MQVLFDQPDLYDEVTSLMDRGQIVDVVYLEFRNIFYRILLEKLAPYGLVWSTFVWVKKKNSWMTKPRADGECSNILLVARLQGFIHELHKVIKCTVSQFAGNIKFDQL